MLIAEDYVLLALESEGIVARGHSYQPYVAIGVQGALVVELILDGHVGLADGRVHLTGTRPDDPLLAQVLDNVAEIEGKKLANRLTTIEHSGWTEVVDRMIDRGLIGREKPSFFAATRHPVLALGAREEILARARAAATGDGPIDPRTASLLAIAGPTQLLEVVAPDKDDHEHAKRRIEAATEQIPAADAVKQSIEALVAAIVIGVVAVNVST